MRFVVKIGTSTLTHGTKRLSSPTAVNLARQIAAIKSDGHELILVTSGAIAAGRELLGFPDLPKDVPAKQMLAAVGQPRLMAFYERIFNIYDVTVAQVLLTGRDLVGRRGYLNARNTLTALVENSVLPIVNENDTVTTEEIRVGDNDNLSALVANLTDADWLILLTDQDGLFTADPRREAGARLIPEVVDKEIGQEILQAASGSVAAGQGTGGMVTKLQAVDLARRCGALCVIANGAEPDVLLRLVRGERLGTRFMPTATAVESRKRYILSGRHVPGLLTIDSGAAAALHQGASLLSIGVVGISGEFDRGDTVRVAQDDGTETARGIVNYDSSDMARILRRTSGEIESILGYYFGDEVIHHNNLALL